MRIYVAGPLSGDEEGNMRKAAAVGAAIAQLGHTVFVPHLNLLMDHALVAAGHERIDYEEWLRQDFEWIQLCHALFKIASSPGTDREEAFARQLGIPVFTNLSEIPVRVG